MEMVWNAAVEIRQLTDVLRCKLQKCLRCEMRLVPSAGEPLDPGTTGQRDDTHGCTEPERPMSNSRKAVS
jgi:hypothetical protein